MPLLLIAFFSCHQLSLPCLLFCCFFFRYFVIVLLYHEDLRELFLPSDVFHLTLLPEIWHNLPLSRLPWDQQFFLEGRRTSHWGSKHRPGLSVCLNHTVFSRRYYSVGSIYVLRLYGTLYQPLPDFKPTV